MWHEARRTEKKVHAYMDEAKKRAEKRAVFLANRKGDPAQALRIVGLRAKMHHDYDAYQAIEQQQGLIPWNNKEDNLIDRFDGRALLDFYRDYDPRLRPPREKTEEEEELEECANFERYRDLIKHRRRGLSDEGGLEDVEAVLEEKYLAPPGADRNAAPQAAGTKQGSYAKVGFSYGAATTADAGEEDESEDSEVLDESSSDDSEDEEIEGIAEEYGVGDFHRLIRLDKRAREDAKKAKAALTGGGDPSVKKLNRKERRKLAAQEKHRDRERGYSLPDPPRPVERRGSPTYEEYTRGRRRTRSRSGSPSLRRQDRDRDRGRGERGRDRERHEISPPKVEFITEFGSEGAANGPAQSGYSLAPPPSPPRKGTARETVGSAPILEALRSDPAAVNLASQATKWVSGRSSDGRPASSARSGASSAALAKLNKIPAPGAVQKSQQPAAAKETPQDRLKRIMSKQLTKQIKRDTVAESAKKKEVQELRERKLEESRRLGARGRSRSTSPMRRRHSSPSGSPRRRYPRSPSRGRSPGRDRSWSRRGRSRSRSRS